MQINTFTYLRQIFFYITLVYYKFSSAFECHPIQLWLMGNEFAFLLSMLGIRKLKSSDSTMRLLDTVFGKFNIRNIDADINIASPSFERLDIQKLMKLINNSLYNNHDVVFIDAGSSFGKYSISIGNRFSRYRKQLRILAFEPDKNSYKMLRKNIRDNGLTNIRTFNSALSNTSGYRYFYFLESMKQIVSFVTPIKIKINTAKLDDYITRFARSKTTDIFIKLDVEGHEYDVLRGCKKLFTLYPNIILMMEDSASENFSGLTSLILAQFNFLTKLTTYNSFWISKRYRQ